MRSSWPPIWVLPSSSVGLAVSALVWYLTFRGYTRVEAQNSKGPWFGVWISMRNLGVPWSPLEPATISTEHHPGIFEKRALELEDGPRHTNVFLRQRENIRHFLGCLFGPCKQRFERFSMFYSLVVFRTERLYLVSMSVL